MRIVDLFDNRYFMYLKNITEGIRSNVRISTFFKVRKHFTVNNNSIKL